MLLGEFYREVEYYIVSLLKYALLASSWCTEPSTIFSVSCRYLCAWSSSILQFHTTSICLEKSTCASNWGMDVYVNIKCINIEVILPVYDFSGV